MEVLIFIAIIYVLFKIPEWKYDNYMPPEGYTVDHNAESLDRIKNHLTNEQVMANTIAGKYNVKR